MAREWAIVLETLSQRAARTLGGELRAENLDVDVDASEARVWLYAETREAALHARDLALRLEERRHKPTLQGTPMLRVWYERRHRYVDPEAPFEDPDTREVWIESELDPADVRWQVRIELESVFDFRRVRRQLPALGRPVIGLGNRHIDLGASDGADAEAVAARCAAFDGVTAATPSEIHGRVRRWLVRQHLAGNYATSLDGSGAGYGYGDFGGGGGDGGGGGGGDGGGGGGH